MRQALADVAIGAAILTSLLTAIDWLLSDAQKSGLSDILIKSWNWLDDVQKRRLLYWLYSGNALLAILIVSALFYIFVFYYSFLAKTGVFNEDKKYLVADLLNLWIFLPGFGVSIVILHYVAKWLGTSNNYITFLKRVTWCSCIIIFNTMITLLPALRQISESIASRFEFAWLTSIVIFGNVGLYAFFLVFVIVILTVVKGILNLSTVIMLRIAESPKGPIFALSAIVGGVAALIKSIS